MAQKCSGIDVSEVYESKGVTVHSVLVGELSSVKNSHSKAGLLFFEGQLSDGKKTIRMVSFKPKLRGVLDKIRKSGEGVALVNCSIQEARCLEVKSWRSLQGAGVVLSHLRRRSKWMKSQLY